MLLYLVESGSAKTFCCNVYKLICVVFLGGVFLER